MFWKIFNYGYSHLIFENFFTQAVNDRSILLLVSGVN